MATKTTPKTKRKTPADAGCINVRISKKAHRAIMKAAAEQRRTFIPALDVLLGV